MPSYDAVIVGAGLIGSAISLRLRQEGLRVALLERDTPGCEASSAGAGMLSPAPDSAASIPLVPFGRASLALYPNFVAEVEEMSGHCAGYRTDGAVELLFSANAERELSTLIALHHALGLPTEPVPLDEAFRLEPALSTRAQAAAFLPYEASVDNRALINVLVLAARTSGVEIVPATPVREIIVDRERCTGVRSQDGTIFATNEIIVAAGAFSGLLKGIVPQIPTRPIRGQMAALRLHGQPLRHVVRSPEGYIVPRDSFEPQRLVTGSTLEDAGFEKRVTAGGLATVLDHAQQIIPSVENAEIIETWSGLRPGTPDHLPLLGPAGIEGLTIATGHFRNGILLTPITAKLVREWITERRVSMDWDVFNPLRFAPHDTPDTEETLPNDFNGTDFARKS